MRTLCYLAYPLAQLLNVAGWLTDRPNLAGSY
jgi:hypothetical protein